MLKAGGKSDSRIRFALPSNDEEHRVELRNTLREFSSKEKRKVTRSTIGPSRSTTSSRAARAISAPNISEYQDNIIIKRNYEDTKIGAYIVGGVLGHGNQGRVCKAIDTRTGTFVAIKEIQIENHDKEAQIEAISKETDLLQQLDHPNILKYITALRRDKYIYHVFEFIENGSLHDILLNFGVFTESLARIYIKQILTGLVYLHEKNIVHRDIKGSNVLITKDGTCKLSDFGLAINEKRLSVRQLSVGTPYWMAPEFISCTVEEVTTSSDIWSLGATLLELITGHPPLHYLAPMVAAFQLIEGTANPIPDGIELSLPLQSFLGFCFQLDPKLRPSAARLLQHPWIAGSREEGDPVASKNLKELTTELKTNRVNHQKLSTRLSKKMRTLSNRNLKEKFEMMGDRIEENELLEEDDSVINQISNDLLKKKYLLLKQKTLSLQSFSNSLMEENRNLKHSQETHQIHSKYSREDDQFIRLRQTNAHLREQIEFLERNIEVCDKDRARMIFESINWGAFENSTKGVLKIGKKTSDKLKKRHVVLQENFLLLFNVDCSDTDEPVDVIWLVDINVNAVISTRFPVNSFELRTRHRHVVVCAASVMVMEKWMKRLSFCCPWFDVEEYKLRSPRTKAELSTSGNHTPPAKSILQVARKKIRHATT